MKLVYSDNHRAHAPPHQFNVTRMGPYSESPERADRILEVLSRSHTVIPPDPISTERLRSVHTAVYLRFLEGVYDAWEAMGGSESGLIPFTYAKPGMDHIPDDLVHAAGHYCFDPHTPIVAGTYEAAMSSASCACTAAEWVKEGERMVYALCRPPGHHAGRSLYGGYCFLNNAAIAATGLGRRVAILDIDYHHGNGTQAIFYDRSDVFFASLHGSPDRAYPYFSGGSSETGRGNGAGKTLNVPLGSDIDDEGYLQALSPVLSAIEQFSPDGLVVSAGFDIYEEDPLGDFRVTKDGLSHIGQAISGLNLPTVVVQEGGYNTSDLGECAAAFLAGLESG